MGGVQSVLPLLARVNTSGAALPQRSVLNGLRNLLVGAALGWNAPA